MNLIFDDWKKKIFERLDDICKKDKRFKGRKFTLLPEFINHPINNTINENIPCVALIDENTGEMFYFCVGVLLDINLNKEDFFTATI